MTDDNDFEEDEEFYDSEAEPSICEDYADESIACGLNESIVCEPHVVKTYYAVQFKNSEEITDRYIKFFILLLLSLFLYFCLIIKNIHASRKCYKTTEKRSGK